MDLLDILTIALAFISLLTASMLVFAFYSYQRLAEKFENLHQAHDHLEKKLHEKQQDVIAESQQEARKILAAATAKAETMIKDAGVLSEKVQQSLDQNLQRLPQMQEDIYRELFDGVNKSMLQMMADLTEEMKAQSAQQVQLFGNTLQKQAELNRQGVKQSLDKVYSTVEEEVRAHKERRMDQVDQMIRAMLSDIAMDVFGTMLSQDNHEALVRKALEEVKERHLFGSPQQQTTQQAATKVSDNAQIQSNSAQNASTSSTLNNTSQPIDENNLDQVASSTPTQVPDSQTNVTAV